MWYVALMRALFIVVLLSSVAYAETKCANVAECEKACSAKNTTACTHAAEMLFDGKAGWPLDHTKSPRARIGKRDVFPLPVPADMQKRFYQSACSEAKIDVACKRLAKMK